MDFDVAISNHANVTTVVYLAASIGSAYALGKGIHWAMTRLDPLHSKKSQGRAKMDKITERLGIAKLSLNEHEEIIANDVVFPEDIDAGFEGSTLTLAHGLILLDMCRRLKMKLF